jgi:hypothetical protein
MQGHVDVTPARWWQVPGLSRLIRETRRQRSGAAAYLWAPQWSPSLGVLQSVWTAPFGPMPGLPGPRSLVAEEHGRPVGLAQMRPRREPHQWEVVVLAVERPVGTGRSAPAGGGDDFPVPLLFSPDRRATRLLGELCDVGVQLGAERIFASIDEDGGRYELFRQIGFSPVVREYLYYGTPERTARAADAVAAPVIPGLRPQQRADAFGLLQLYQACTPKVVQMAEGKRSRSWDLPAESWVRRLTRHPREQRWVVERDSRKVAWLHLARRGREASAALHVEMMVEPGASDLCQPLLQLALVTAGKEHAVEERPGMGILVDVREHLPGLLAALEAYELDMVERRLLMVKQLAAAVRHHQLVPALEKVV